MFWLLAGLLVLIGAADASSIFSQNAKKCEPVTLELCKSMPYNLTYYANSVVQIDEVSLSLQTEHYKPLIRTQCSPHLQFFVCSVFAPMCPEQLPQPVTSCRSVCLQVQRDCANILESFGLEWPDVLNCSRFPEQPALCMTPSETDSRDTELRSFGLPPPADAVPGTVHRVKTHSSICPQGMVQMESEDGLPLCSWACQADGAFSAKEKEKTLRWMIRLGAAAMALSLLAFLTFLLDRDRFKYPERSVFWQAVCWMGSSLALLWPLVADFPTRACLGSSPVNLHLAIGQLDSPHCAITFVLSYFSQLAAAHWWLVFGFTWYLSASRKWVPEGIAGCASYMHVVAWGVPCLLTCLVLVTHQVDAFELSGLCDVGRAQPTPLLLFQILPRATLLFLGASFVVAALSASCRERDAFRARGCDTSRLEKLLLKTGVFCVLHIVAALCGLIGDGLHWWWLRDWHAQTTSCPAKRALHLCRPMSVRPYRPPFELYMLSIVASVSGSVGVFLWVCAGKTLTTWRRMLCCAICASAPAKTGATVQSQPLLTLNSGGGGGGAPSVSLQYMPIGGGGGGSSGGGRPGGWLPISSNAAAAGHHQPTDV